MVQILFSTQPNDLLSRLVRWATKSQTSHASIVFEALGRLWVLEAVAIGVVIIPFDKFSDKVVALIPVPEVTDEHLSKALEKYLGVNYDYAGLFGMVVNYLGRWLRARWNNPWASSKTVFCSELCTKVLQESGYPGSDTLVAANTSPQDLLKFLSVKQS